MIVCICKSISDKTIRKMALSGSDLEKIQKETLAGTQCQCCIPCIKDIIEKPIDDTLIFSSGR